MDQQGCVSHALRY